MNKTLKFQEFVIVITAKQHNPTVLTPDFLKYSGIVSHDWELARQPILTNSAAQVVFTNGISIVAEVNRIIFSEVLVNKELQNVQIPAIARKYIETLAQVNYQGIGLNFRGYVLFDQNNTAHDYIFKTLLNPGPWQELGKAPAQAAVRFFYTLEGVQLSIDVNEAGLELPDKIVTPAIVFTANFNHKVTPENQSQLLPSLLQVINNWQTDLETYQEVINTKFLRSGSYQLNLAPSGEPIPIKDKI